jgi:polyhydroxybutyrate depolymerase
MCYLLACYQPATFRAIATVAATMMNRHFDACQPSETVPLLSIFGTSDQTTNYQGDETNQDGWGAYKSIPAVLDLWSGQIQYDTLITDTLPDLSKQDSSFVIRETYRNTSFSREFLYYKVVGGGHDWPGAWGNEDVKASAEIWQFFERYMMPELSR